jgi:hypothetical protein
MDHCVAAHVDVIGNRHVVAEEEARGTPGTAESVAGWSHAAERYLAVSRR